jgi:hypothetical protein
MAGSMAPGPDKLKQTEMAKTKLLQTGRAIS